jgi:hypothetical protein
MSTDTAPVALAERHDGAEPVVVVAGVADALDVAPGETTAVTVRDDGAVVLEPRGGPGE